MKVDVVQSLMEEFATATGVSGNGTSRRYLWTDAFAVCNFLELARLTEDTRYLLYAHELVHQVHHVLGRFRSDDPRRGWISGLSEEEGERHPTRGGLRIGKPLKEREHDQPMDSELEWQRDGQYFHYLTKWMHALYRMSQETGDSRYHVYATELAATAHRAFYRKVFPAGSKRLVWKMSTDLNRCLISSTGQHDPLDGLVTGLELQTARSVDPRNSVDLSAAIADMTHLCAQDQWATDDPLGIGGLLDNAARLAVLIFDRGVRLHALLQKLLLEAERSLEEMDVAMFEDRPAAYRLAFREIGLAIGLNGLPRILASVEQNHVLARIGERLQPFASLADRIVDFWSERANQSGKTWADLRDINTVMLATALAPESYLKV